MFLRSRFQCQMRNQWTHVTTVNSSNYFDKIPHYNVLQNIISFKDCQLAWLELNFNALLLTWPLVLGSMEFTGNSRKVLTSFLPPPPPPTFWGPSLPSPLIPFAQPTPILRSFLIWQFPFGSLCGAFPYSNCSCLWLNACTISGGSANELVDPAVAKNIMLRLCHHCDSALHQLNEFLYFPAMFLEVNYWIMFLPGLEGDLHAVLECSECPMFINVLRVQLKVVCWIRGIKWKTGGESMEKIPEILNMWDKSCRWSRRCYRVLFLRHWRCSKERQVHSRKFVVLFNYLRNMNLATPLPI